jgi:hypothetical protein
MYVKNYAKLHKLRCRLNSLLSVSMCIWMFEIVAYHQKCTTANAVCKDHALLLWNTHESGNLVQSVCERSPRHVYSLFLCPPYNLPLLARTGCEMETHYLCTMWWKKKIVSHLIVWLLLVKYSWLYYLLLPLGRRRTLHLSQMNCSSNWPMSHWL